MLGTRWFEVTGSILDDVIGIFYWHNLPDRTVALGLTQPPTEMSNIKLSRYRPGVAQRLSRSIALLFHDLGTRRGWVVSSTPRPHFTPGKDPVPILQEAGWAPEQVWRGGKPRLQRDSIPDRSEKWVPGIFPGEGKGYRCLDLTNLRPSCTDCLETREPQPSGKLRACPSP